jgi:hypothetical protein
MNTDIKNYIILIIILISIIIIYESIKIGNFNIIKEAFKNIKKPDFTLYDEMVELNNDKKENKLNKLNKSKYITYEDDFYKLKINIVKTYLEDPITRGANIYASEQYAKIDDIGQINLDDNSLLPKASNFVGDPAKKIIYPETTFGIK